MKFYVLSSIIYYEIAEPLNQIILKAINKIDILSLLESEECFDDVPPLETKDVFQFLNALSEIELNKLSQKLSKSSSIEFFPDFVNVSPKNPQ